MTEFAFQWHLTDACDQRCRHCYLYNAKPEALCAATWDEMERVLENVLDFGRTFGRTPYFYLTGGDPILHPDFWRLLERLHALGLAATVMGNPFHVTPAAAARMRALGVDKYQLSLDGLRDTHDFFRKPGSFDATLAAIPVLREAGVPVCLMATVSARNAPELPDLIDLAADREADIFAFGRYCPSGADRTNGLEPLAYRALLVECRRRIEERKATGCRTYFHPKDHLWTLLDWEEGRFRIPPGADPATIYGGCNCGNCHLTILPDGTVMACRRVPGSVVGNALRDRLADLWTGPMERYRDFARFAKCARCELLRFCRGCPAVAASTALARAVAAGAPPPGPAEAFYAPDPQCWHPVAERPQVSEPPPPLVNPTESQTP